jgi:site-specific recombinase XerD
MPRRFCSWQIILVMSQAGDDRHGLRLRALIAVLWRGGLRISEGLALCETDGDERRGSLRIRYGKGDSAARRGWMSGDSSSCAAGWSIGSSCRSVRCCA